MEHHLGDGGGWGTLRHAGWAHNEVGVLGWLSRIFAEIGQCREEHIRKPGWKVLGSPSNVWSRKESLSQSSCSPGPLDGAGYLPNQPETDSLPLHIREGGSAWRRDSLRSHVWVRARRGPGLLDPRPVLPTRQRWPGQDVPAVFRADSISSTVLVNKCSNVITQRPLLHGIQIPSSGWKLIHTLPNIQLCGKLLVTFVCLFAFWVFLRGHTQLPAYTTATAMWDLSRVFDLHHNSWQCRELNPLSEARDQIHILTDSSRICFHFATTGTPCFWLWFSKMYYSTPTSAITHS